MNKQQEFIFGKVLRWLLVIALLLFFSIPMQVRAQEECTEAKLRDLGVAIINCTGDTNKCSVGGSLIGGSGGSRAAPGSRVYVLGDSITVGMRDNGSLGAKINAAGLVTEKINAVGGEDLSWGQSQLEADATIISTAGVVVIGLGTNNIGTVVTNGDDGPSRAIEGGQQTLERIMQTMINTINPSGAETKKQIFWTTVFVKGTLTTDYGTFNMDIAMPIINAAIKNIASTNGVTIIPWDTNPQAPTYTAQDGIHPSGYYPEMADFVVSSLTNPGAQATQQPSNTQGCVCSTTSSIAGSGGTRDERYRAAWSYFTTTKGLSEGAAAGVMGNLEAESGIDPHNVQNNATYNGEPVPDGPEIPYEKIKGSYGYGIAQWTSSGRQENLMGYAAETFRSTGDMGLQLDFLWKELTESYTGVAAVLQTPGVTFEEVSYVFLSEFEIPAPFTDSGTQAQRDAETENRRAKSEAIFNEFSGQSIPGSTGASCNETGGAIDLVSADTTHIPCGPGTNDAGVADGYRDGKLIKIRLCSVAGTQVNSQISGSIAKMMSDSQADGINMSIGGFRAMEGCANCQVEMYQSRCTEQGLTPTPAPYPKEKYSDYQACDSIAPPGYSNHQAGLAVDVSCNGVLIPRYQPTAGSDPCFQWLDANASRYGLFEFGKGEGNRNSGSYEAWHWSVDGN